MDKASKAIRRSGVRLKSIGGGHSDLNMLISELKDVRQAAKAFMQAQNTASQDMLKWSVNDPNRAVQDVVSQLAELNSLWTEVQKEFSEQLKDFKYQFDMILEGERHVDQARNHMAACEQQEMRLKKELKKAAKKATTEEINRLEIKLGQAERAKDLAQLEVLDRIRENEMIKMVRFKEGLIKVSEAYIELATKCAVIFEAQRDITYHLPDVQSQGRDIHEIKYTGSGATKQTVIKTRDKVRMYRQASSLIPRSQPIEEPPPPYSQHYNDIQAYSYNPPTTTPSSGTNGARSNQYVDLNTSTPADNHQHQHRHIRQRAVPSCPQQLCPEDDVRWNNSDYEEDLSGAMGGAKI